MSRNFIAAILCLIMVVAFVVTYVSLPPANDAPEETTPRESEPISVVVPNPAAVAALEETRAELEETLVALERFKAGMDAQNFLRRARSHADKYVETGDPFDLELAQQATEIAFKAACAYGEVATMVKVVEWMKAFKVRVELWEQMPQSQPNDVDEGDQDG